MILNSRSMCRQIQRGVGVTWVLDPCGKAWKRPVKFAFLMDEMAMVYCLRDQQTANICSWHHNAI